MKGERKGKPYRGLLYTVLDGEGKKAEITPLKSSIFGKSLGYDALEKRMKQSGETIAKDNSRENTRQRVAEAFLNAPTENEIRKNRIKKYRICQHYECEWHKPTIYLYKPETILF